jgi:D-sedoheptulose 7-phosphate isomerase
MRNSAFIHNYFQEMQQIIDGISRQDIDNVVELLFDTWQRGNSVFIIGNGGSASTATHFACDLAKCTIVEDKPRFKVMSLTDNVPLTSAWTNDSGFGNLFSEQLKSFMGEGDVLIAISVHGGVGEDKAGPWSQNLVKAMQLAKERKAFTVGFSGFDGGIMKETADECVVVPYPSTPQVESFHLALEHLICFCLKEKIEAHPNHNPSLPQA